jgi:hypothetical protein
MGAQIARFGLAVLAPEPHRTTRQPVINREHRTGDLCAQGHKRICADTVHAHPVVRAPLWRDVLCSDYELRSAFRCAHFTPRGRLSLRRGSRPEATSHLTACRDDPKAVPAKMAG